MTEDEYDDNECVGCHKIIPVGLCLECPKGTGKVLKKTSGVQITSLGAPIERPFEWSEFEPGGMPDGEALTADHLVKHLIMRKKASPRMDKIVERYRQISGADEKLDLTISEEFIQEKLIDPLIEAKSSFVIGNWLATIALCGIVCECLSLIIWRMSYVSIAIEVDHIHRPELAEHFAKDVEAMTQKERLDFLRKIGLLTDDEYNKLDNIRDIRNKYVHYAAKVSPETQRDNALTLFRGAVGLVANVILVGMAPTGPVVNKRLLRYISTLPSTR